MTGSQILTWAAFVILAMFMVAILTKTTLSLSFSLIQLNDITNSPCLMSELLRKVGIELLGQLRITKHIIDRAHGNIGQLIAMIV